MKRLIAEPEADLRAIPVQDEARFSASDDAK